MPEHIRLNDDGELIFDIEKEGTFTKSEDDTLDLLRKGLHFEEGRNEFKAERDAFEKEKTDRETDLSREKNLLGVYEEYLGPVMERILNSPNEAAARTLAAQVGGFIEQGGGRKPEATPQPPVKPEEGTEWHPFNVEAPGETAPDGTPTPQPTGLSKEDVMAMLDDREMMQKTEAQVYGTLDGFRVRGSEGEAQPLSQMARQSMFEQTVRSASRTPGADLAVLTTEIAKQFGAFPAETPTVAAPGSTELSNLGVGAGVVPGQDAPPKYGTPEWEEQAARELDAMSEQREAEAG